jgi:protein gp37
VNVNKTKIEWVKNPDGSQGYTWNPITGCLNHVNGLCKGGGFPCYAYKLAHGRLSSHYLSGGVVASEGIDHENLSAPFYPRFWEERLTEPCGVLKDELNYDPRSIKPKGIFVCDMSDLFGVGIPESWTRQVMDIIKACPWHRFYLLTKQPQNLIKWSPFPENVYIGVTATNQRQYDDALKYLKEVKAKVKFLSFEPLLEHIEV